METKSLKKKLFFGFGTILIIFFVLLVFYFNSLKAPDNEKVNDQQFDVVKGQGLKAIASNLKQQGLIKSDWAFVLYAYLSNSTSKIKAGTYFFQTSMDSAEILSALVDGRVEREETNITIIEGWSNAQLVDALVVKDYFTKNEILNSMQESYSQNIFTTAKQSALEGFLFPDTYSIKLIDGPPALISAALNNFEKKVSTQMIETASKNGLNLFEYVTLASIVEKEVGRNADKVLDQGTLALMQKERELVASVFYNRLEIGMPLQSDATVNYITGKKDRQVLFKDTEIESEYNTYKYIGLPPGPISNPGLGSLLAVSNPAKTDYLYFLNTKDGTAIFSKTLEEHNRNKEKYLR